MDATGLVHVNMYDLMKERVRTGADQPAFYCDGRRYTWGECDELSDLLAVKLLDRGLTSGTHVGVWSLNDISELVFLVAAMKVGIVPAVINYSYKGYELEHVINRAHLTGLFIGKQKCHTDYWQMAFEANRDREQPLMLAGILEDFEEACRARLNGYVISAAQREQLGEAASSVDPGDPACLVFTSGSTKEPKPVLLSFDSIVNDARGFSQRLGVRPDDVILAPVPLFHCSGMTGLLFHAAVTGAMGIIQPFFQAEESLALIRECRASILMLVPTMAELLMASRDFPGSDLSSLRAALFSGSEITPSSYRRMRRKLGLHCILNSYGQTECSPIITTTLPDDDDAAAAETVGVPLAQVQIRICDARTDRELPTGQVGEIQVRGFNTMIGYYNFPEEMAKKYAADGWLKTSDAGWLDEAGRLHFSCRIDETIIKGGENISPSEIEEVVNSYSDDIESVKVVGVPSQKYGEDIACILTAGHPIDPTALKAHVKARLASFKTPGYVFQVAEMPRTATDKVSLRDCRNLARKLVEEQVRTA